MLFACFMLVVEMPLPRQPTSMAHDVCSNIQPGCDDDFTAHMDTHIPTFSGDTGDLAASQALNTAFATTVSGDTFISF